MSPLHCQLQPSEISRLESLNLQNVPSQPVRSSVSTSVPICAQKHIVVDPSPLRDLSCSSSTQSLYSFCPIEVLPTTRSASSTLHPFDSNEPEAIENDSCLQNFPLSLFTSLQTHLQEQNYFTQQINPVNSEMSFFPDVVGSLEGSQPPSQLDPLLAPTENESARLASTPSTIFSLLSFPVSFCLASLLAPLALFLDYMALRCGWSPITIVGLASVFRLMCLVSADIYAEYCKQHTREEVESLNSPVNQPGGALGACRGIGTCSKFESAYVEASEKFQFNLELVDLIVPLAFLQLLHALLPVVVLRSYADKEVDNCQGFSIVPLALLSSSVLGAQIVRVLRCQISKSHHSSSEEEAASRQHQSWRSPEKTLETSPTLSESNMTMIQSSTANNLESRRFMKRPSQYLFRQSEEDLFDAETILLPASEPVWSGVFVAVQKLRVEAASFIRLMFQSVSRSRELPHIVILSLGMCLLCLTQFQFSLIALLSIYALASLILKYLLTSGPIHYLSENFRLLFEYHLCVIEIGIAAIFLVLGLNQVVVESVFFNDVLLWKSTTKRTRTTTTTSSAVWSQYMILAISSGLRLLSDHEAQKLVTSEWSKQKAVGETTIPTLLEDTIITTTTTTHTKQRFESWRWVEILGAIFWFLISESWDFLIDLYQSRNNNLTDYVKSIQSFSLLLSLFSGLHWNDMTRCLSGTLLIIGLCHSAVIRNNKELSNDIKGAAAATTTTTSSSESSDFDRKSFDPAPSTLQLSKSNSLASIQQQPVSMKGGGVPDQESAEFERIIRHLSKTPSEGICESPKKRMTRHKTIRFNNAANNVVMTERLRSNSSESDKFFGFKKLPTRDEDERGAVMDIGNLSSFARSSCRRSRTFDGTSYDANRRSMISTMKKTEETELIRFSRHPNTHQSIKYI